MEFEIQRCSRQCSKSGRLIEPGEAYYSVLANESGTVVRHDYATEAWDGPPETYVGWWKARLPGGKSRKPTWAPNDVMLELFGQLEQQPDQADTRFVLSLLLVRRRVMRLDGYEREADGSEVALLHCARQSADYRIPSVKPSPGRMQAIQDRLAGLLQ